MRFEPLLLLLGLVVASCASLDPAAKQTGLAVVEGNWIYSHIGSPTVWQAGLPDPGPFIDTKMQGTRISIARDGTASLREQTGTQRDFKLRAAEESDLAIELAGLDLNQSKEFTWSYEKKPQLLVMPLDLTLPGNQTGVIPAYFRRE